MRQPKSDEEIAREIVEKYFAAKRPAQTDYAGYIRQLLEFLGYGETVYSLIKAMLEEE